MKILEVFINVGGYLMILVAFIKIMQIRLMNSHLTETQLFMQEWDAWLAVTAICIAGCAAIALKMD